MQIFKCYQTIREDSLYDSEIQIHSICKCLVNADNF